MYEEQRNVKTFPLEIFQSLSLSSVFTMHVLDKSNYKSARRFCRLFSLCMFWINPIKNPLEFVSSVFTMDVVDKSITNPLVFVSSVFTVHVLDKSN